MSALPIFVAALPREIAPLVRACGLRAEPDFLDRGIYVYRHPYAVFACAGMGADRASLAVEAALSLVSALELVSIGWAGACTSRVGLGRVIDADVVIDARTGERFYTADSPEREESQVVVTIAAPASVQEKGRLRDSYGAVAVEMEAAAVARIARARELPFRAIKAISDEVDFELPDVSRFVTSQGGMREAAFGLHVALRPALWRSVLGMAKGSKLAAGNLCAQLRARIEQYGNYELTSHD